MPTVVLYKRLLFLLQGMLCMITMMFTIVKLFLVIFLTYLVTCN